MNTSGKRRRTLLALTVVVLALVCVTGVMAYRTAYQGTGNDHSPQATNPQQYQPPDGGRAVSESHEDEYGEHHEYDEDDEGEYGGGSGGGNTNAAGTCQSGCQSVVTTTRAS
ncbi:hypothetical protein ZOD2009_07074 [Haladaptatus paucihalophilus DX253]|uniref:Uncharacterized protein n=1 Tax=Haladaptatus paucihalophilus DX253 TaxID=797209 RepID=E7QRJ2_HALPU|nr:hypothetical protein [Haladaptatus paucihalophilus]EFW92611.1 hypothetical protein ZOD2009_07074 [Haladaptatus paucihalophilus DX253]SHK17703.1 hypothetical protein SAMN05444342_0846 [Haladaptatus paucihalophilus DX253]